MSKLAIGLVAHDARKSEMVAWASRHVDFLKNHNLFATGTTGKLILDANPHLALTRLKSGPLGGDQQLGALVCDQKLDALFFFVDPMSSMPHDVDVKALIRLSTLYNIPMGCNERTSDMVLSALKFEYPNL